MRHPRPLLALLFTLFAFLTSPPAHAKEGEVAVSAVASRNLVVPGDQVVIAVLLEHREGWHSQADLATIKASGSALAAFETTIEPTATPGFRFGPIQWPKAVMVSAAALGDPDGEIPVFEGTAIAYIPVVIAPNAAPGMLTLPVVVKYQVCDDKVCLFPETANLEVSLSVGTSPAAGTTSTTPGSADPALFTNFDPSIFAKMLSGEVTSEKPLEFNFFGRTFTIQTTGVGLLLLLLLAVLGGFLLNLTPCVLPVIPIKIMGLQHSAGTASRRILLGVVMFLGVISFWMALGAAIAFIKGFSAANQLFQYPAFTIGVGAFVAIMAIGMLGLFTINLPNWVYAIDPKRESLVGSFLFGIMTAVLATPCTAPFMGTAMVWAATQPVPTLLATFGAIGVGMGLPYLVLALVPQLVAKVPRTGPASELVKQVMGLLMLAVAVFFIGSGIDPLVRLPIDPAIRWHWWIVGALVVIAAVWLVVRTWAITKSPARRGVWSVLGLALAGVGAWLGVNLSSHGPIDWVGYTPARLAEATSAGKVVVLDFTAEWCINCKALESGVLHQQPVVDLFDSGKAIPMKVDLTGDNADGAAKLKELQWVGIPLLAIFGPGAPEPLKYDSYTIETVLDAVAKAGGGTSAN